MVRCPSFGIVMSWRVEPFFYDEIDGGDPGANRYLKMPADSESLQRHAFAPGSIPSASVTRDITTSAIIAGLMNIVTTLLASLFEGYSVWRW